MKKLAQKGKVIKSSRNRKMIEIPLSAKLILPHFDGQNHCTMVFGNFPRGCRVEDLFDNMGKLYLYMRKHKNPGIQMLFTTQTYRPQKTHFNGARDLFDTNKKTMYCF